MCAYNGVNGDPMCMSPMLSDVLENDFNFKAPSKPENYIVTDSGALSFMISKFHKFNQSSDAAAAALVAGVDLNSGNVFKGLLNLFEHNDTRVSIGMVCFIFILSYESYYD
jgi:beta-glucosidase-like glycosyl hydrolase